MNTETALKTEENPSYSDVFRVISSGESESWSAEKILRWGIENFHPRIALSCSFGAPEGLVLLDMMHRIEPRSRVFVLDTGRLPQATYNLIDRVRQRYDKAVEVVFPDAGDIEAMLRRDGPNLFYESIEKRRLCCRLRKVEPLRRYLAQSALDAWVTGRRREQSVTRENVRKIEIDPAHERLVKFNPLADWTAEDVQHYAQEHRVPLNRLHAEGYPSVGCSPCSRAVGPGEDVRAGRWWWESAESKECGIHVGEEADGSGI